MRDGRRTCLVEKTRGIGVGKGGTYRIVWSGPAWVALGLLRRVAILRPATRNTACWDRVRSESMFPLPGCAGGVFPGKKPRVKQPR